MEGGGGVRFLLILCLHLVIATRTHREHKIHNIVIYPDKHSWCNTTPIKQVVAWPGCVAREIDNNVCVGACFSYTIPLTEPSLLGDVISPYCDSCQPSEVTWEDVTLECTNEDEQIDTLAPEPITTPQTGVVSSNTSAVPRLMQKRVQMIKNCSCAACHGHSHHHEGENHHHGNSNHHNQQPSLLDEPELMGLMKQVHTRKLAQNHTNLHLHSSLLREPSEETVESEEEKKEVTTEAIISQSPETTIHPNAEILESSVSVESFKSSEDTNDNLKPPSHESFTPLEESQGALKPIEDARDFKKSEDSVKPVSHESFKAATTHEAHGHHGHHGHHPHHHHTHHHEPPPAQLEVPQEKLHPAQEGVEMSYQDNLVTSNQSQEKVEEF